MTRADMVTRLTRLVRSCTAVDNAAMAHRALVAVLRDAGARVAVEVACPHGRVDIVAQLDGWQTAIEIDNRSPRKKSLIKLRGYPADTIRLVVLRKPSRHRQQHDGIDAVVVLPAVMPKDVAVRVVTAAMRGATR